MSREIFYVYGHFLLTGEIFYVGKGKDDRAYSKSHRNKHWKNKVKKHGGFKVLILQDKLCEDLAYEVEKSFIESIGLENLCNIKEGGGGQSGWRLSEETKKKMRASSKRLKMSEEHKEKLRQINLGKKRSKEAIEKTRQSNLGRKHSEETKENMRKRRPSDETLQKLRNNSGTRGKFGKDSCRARPIAQYTKDRIFVKTWGALRDIERELGIDHSYISKCCMGKAKTSGGFIWKYAHP